MDPSALIFVALAVAWAVYLVPKALEHHDESLRNRTVSTFSHTMRVLARREPVSGRATRLVAGAPAPSPAPASATSSSEVRATEARRPSKARGATPRTRSAAARRRTVLLLLLTATIAVAVAAALGTVAWAWMAAPVIVLLAWLVTCRLMVRRERSARATPRGAGHAPVRRGPVSGSWNDETGEIPAAAAGHPVVAGAVLDDAALDHAMLDHAADRAAADVAAGATGRWDPVDVPLPTYVSKPPAVRRTVRTIDLDSTGVWSSGRSEADSALAREAEAAEAAGRDARQEQAQRRAAGS